ncbi:heme NO-binding domain-containing protein [Roseicitreum antarcticum]|uniref:Haem-NO-binding n=1 Tax=Roseicitreum antarcticum TaxID=564137 RepID=A0A1H2U2N0_9RHOB|nr:heme NO-binding domain-containing protein [Roseicitreum antarcticum]SDW50426.1 Haem-NO-binding [Roseicitreum antarcticum]
MHGLIFKALQGFFADTYGPAMWDGITRQAKLEARSFESMLIYDDSCVDDILTAATDRLNRPRSEVLEDIGTYLVSHPRFERLRRLLRFGGVDFTDFLYSIEDLPDRARLAVPDLGLPHMDLTDCRDGAFTLRSTSTMPGYSFVLAGLLRALADDYGVLIMVDDPAHQADAWTLGPNRETLSIRVLDASYAAGRQFDLAAGALS